MRGFVHVSPVGVCTLVNFLLAERASSRATLGLWSPADCGARWHPVPPKNKTRVRTPATAHASTQNAVSISTHWKIDPTLKLNYSTWATISWSWQCHIYAHDCCYIGHDYIIYRSCFWIYRAEYVQIFDLAVRLLFWCSFITIWIIFLQNRSNLPYLFTYSYSSLWNDLWLCLDCETIKIEKKNYNLV